MKLSAKLGTMIATAAGVLAFFIYLMTRLSTPEMALLYGELDNQDSGQIAAKLDEMQQSYRVSTDGSQIFVSSDQVGRARVAMAEQGLPSGGSIGYEIFDRSDGIGTTNFVQNINHLRALEGELARTIRSIASIKQARVHLVLPQRQLFSRDKQEASASIVLTRRGGRSVGREQVLAIQHMVAAAVPELQPEKVSIVDSNGNLLARSMDPDNVNQAANTAEEMRISYENRIARTIEELLARSLGAGNVRVQVSADMDFDRITENSETYDPNGQVVRSTQVVEETNSETDGEPAGITVGANLPGAELPQLDEGTGSASEASRIEETVNYEISRTTRTHIRETGIVRQLSVAVMVNGKQRIDEEGNISYEPLQQQELDQIATLVRSAVGLNDARGDRLEIVNMPFISTAAEVETIGFDFMGMTKADLMKLVEIVVLGLLAIMVLFFVVRPLMIRLLSGEDLAYQAALGSAAIPGISGSVADIAALGGPQNAPGNFAPPELEDPYAAQRRLPQTEDGQNVADEIEHMIDVNKIEGRVRASSVRKIGEIIQKHPDEAVGILRNWLYQGD